MSIVETTRDLWRRLVWVTLNFVNKRYGIAPIMTASRVLEAVLGQPRERSTTVPTAAPVVIQPPIAQGQVWHKSWKQGDVVLVILDDPSGDPEEPLSTIADFTSPDVAKLSPSAKLSLIRASQLPPHDCTLVQTLTFARCVELWKEAVGICGGYLLHCASCGSEFVCKHEYVKDDHSHHPVVCSECKSKHGKWANA